MSQGVLTVVGLGIKLGLQPSPETINHIKDAEKVFVIAADSATCYWISKLNPTTESLHKFYGFDKDRLISYYEMVEAVLSVVRQNLNVCMVSYGHPGVFAFPMHEAIRQARAEGFGAQMLPAISAEDCLYADLGVDPGNTGCQSFEATDFLVYKRIFDKSCALILWQIGVIGNPDYRESYSLEGLNVLADVLIQHYGGNHKVVLYEAAQYPVCEPRIEITELKSIGLCNVNPITTLYIPPGQKNEPDLEMLHRLGIDIKRLRNERIEYFNTNRLR
jgi:precorrin-3B methylase